MLETIAIVGRPNVGKSSLFNRILGQKISIVDDRPGVTRDRIYSTVKWQKSYFNLIDTGGIEIANSSFQEQIQIQVRIAISEAKIILFVIDGYSHLTNDDIYIAKLLRKNNKKVILVINKTENKDKVNDEFYKLGFNIIFWVSSLHGQGIGNLLDEISHNLNKNETHYSDITKLTIIGKPNVGKSSLLNILSQNERSIVSNIPGTTRDSTSSIIKINDIDYEVIDTAGILKKSKLVDSIDHYALIRAMNSLSKSDIVLLVMDSTNQLTKFDAKIMSYALDKNKPLIIVINKWDLISKNTYTMSTMEKKIRCKFPFVHWAPIVFISALEKTRISKLKKVINLVHKNMHQNIKTSILNRILIEIITFKPPKPFNGGIVQIKYITQIQSSIPTFMLFINNKKFLHFSYKRFILNQFYEYFNFFGVPINLRFVNTKNKKQQ